MVIWSFYDKTNIVILTCTTDIAHTPTHPTLMYDICTSTLGTKCMLPVSYTWQQPWAAPAAHTLPPHFINSNNHRHVGRMGGNMSVVQVRMTILVLS